MRKASVATKSRLGMTEPSIWYLSEAKVQKTKELAYCHVQRLEDAGA